MADITLKLIWYRLGESYANMADRYERFLEWYEDFSWRRVDILDMLFLGWLLAAFLVVGLINLYLRLFGRLRGGKGVTGGDGGWGRLPGVGAGGAGESCQWFNSALSWLYLHLDHTPAFVDSWLRALNEHVRKQAGGEVQVKIERLQSGSLPPKFTSIATSVSPQDTLTIQSQVESSDLTFLVSTLQQSGSTIKVSNCDVTLHKLAGQLKVVARYGSDQIDVTAQWITPPQLNMTVKQRSFESNVDPKQLENIMREAIGSAVTQFTVSPKSALGSIYTPSKSDTMSTPSAAQPVVKGSMLASSSPSVSAVRPLDSGLRLRANASTAAATTNTTPATKYVLPTLRPPPAPPIHLAKLRSTSTIQHKVEPSNVSSKNRPASPTESPLSAFQLELNSVLSKRVTGKIDSESNQNCESDTMPDSGTMVTTAKVVTISKTQGDLKAQASAGAITVMTVSSKDTSDIPNKHESSPSIYQPVHPNTIRKTRSLQLGQKLSEPPQQLGPHLNSSFMLNYKAPMSSLNANRDLTSLRNRRLLVKVIKANGLGDKDFGCSDPYCLVSMDTPQQKHSTSVVRNTNNPFWDEHFLFDLEESTRQVKFEVYDREKPPGDDFMGQASLPMADLRRMPSSRQIVPLQPRTPGAKSASGSITVEFLFMEPAEANQMQLNTSNMSADSLSPRRRIDTNRTVTPGGTIVTMKTTTTEKPRDIRLESSYSESPSRIQKTDSTSNFRPDSSPYSSHSSQVANESSTSASQVPGHQAALESPKLTVTQANTLPPGGQYSTATMPEPGSLPLIQMNEGMHMDDGSRDGRSLSTVSAGSDPREMKKSRSFASAFKRRFGRGPKKARSHSADRASSFREGSLLKPPGQAGPVSGPRTTDDLDTVEVPEGGMRKSRSHSFSSSLKRIFRKKKKGDYPSSRESSVSRMSARGYDGSREPSIAQPSPQMSGRDPYGTSRDPYAYQDLSPDVAARREIEDRDYPYSRSVPVASPLYDR